MLLHIEGAKTQTIIGGEEGLTPGGWKADSSECRKAVLEFLLISLCKNQERNEALQMFNLQTDL